MFGTNTQVDVYRLTTLDPRLTAYQFEQYGEYRIDLEGSIQDLWGNRYGGGGSYSVLIAEPLALFPTTIPGTPFEVGDTLNMGVRVMPGAAASLTAAVRVYPLDGSQVIEKTIAGEANRYGYFQPGDGDFRFEVPGEYIIEYEARYQDAEGKLWAASLRSAGVIAPPSGALIAHGRRGLNGVDTSWRPAWFSTLRYNVPDKQTLGINYPYYSGDVLRYADIPNTRVSPGLTVQDTSGLFQSWLMQRLPAYRSPEGYDLAQLAARDSLPVFTLSSADAPYSVSLAPQRIENNAYTYLTAARPGVLVRQMVVGAEDGGLPLWWNTNEPANGQIGAGVRGEAVGDFLFLFGGAVIRNTALNLSETATYAALAIVVDGLPVSVYPPYRGQAGGADGGPLLVIRDQPVDIFFHPTAVLPGQVLTVGDSVVVAGQVAPPLASRLLVTITDPEGQMRAYYEGDANSVGYFNDPSLRVIADKPGIWKIGVVVRHQGLSSAGVIQPPLPQGGILGVQSGVFPVYVVPEGSQALDWNNNRVDFPIPGATPYNFNFNLPREWTKTAVEYVASIPGYVISSGPVNVSGVSFSYQYNPTNLSRDFPMIETDARLDGPAASDPVTLTFAATGIDAQGQRQIRTRTFTIFHDRLMTLE